jgi:hypothetical protein
MYDISSLRMTIDLGVMMITSLINLCTTQKHGAVATLQMSAKFGTMARRSRS